MTTGAIATPQARSNDNPLAHSALAVTITDLAAEYALTHSFRNTGERPMEAVYSFPVPLDAAFLGMEARLAGEHLVAEVRPRADATREYDDALAEGDSAVLLERLEPGMLCVNLGNPRPRETGDITLRFAAPLPCADGAARFILPLVHRPRYGHSLLDELAEPDHDFAVEHPLQATIRVRGLLARVPVSCARCAAPGRKRPFPSISIGAGQTQGRWRRPLPMPATPSLPSPCYRAADRSTPGFAWRAVGTPNGLLLPRPRRRRPCGRALDNIFVERLWRSVKYEEVILKQYRSMYQARAAEKGVGVE